MESLALMVALIVLPAMFGGPISLILTLWNLERISVVRQVFIYILAIASMVVGIFLVLLHVSRGALFIGIMGVVTAALALWRVITRKRAR
ncbi:MAG: hypothetical protein RLZZ251_400 [Actinomycetota bacterium]|jgi:hypothetical protein